MRNIIWPATMALAIGCATTQPAQDTATAQAQAAQSLQAASDAQNQANYEQQKAEQANQNVIATQQDLAQQRAYARDQTLRAQQAQANAQQAEINAHEQGAYAQEKAIENQQIEASQAPIAAPPPHVATAQVIEGQVVSATDDNIALRTLHSGVVNLSVQDFTRISLDGQPVGRASNLMPGEDVRASFQVVDGQPQALRVHVHGNMSPIPQTH
jgi:hypothetical protein